MPRIGIAVGCRRSETPVCQADSWSYVVLCCLGDYLDWTRKAEQGNNTVGDRIMEVSTDNAAATGD